MQKLLITLWFDDQAQEAANFYVSLFEDSKIKNVTHYGKAGQEITKKEPGSVMTVSFQLNGQDFMALNGGPEFKFTEAISILVNCKDQDEIDRLWTAFTKEGQPGPCGWLKDKYGVSWQIVPKELGEMINDPDPAKSERVMAAMLKMGKIEVDKLREAYNHG